MVDSWEQGSTQRVDRQKGETQSGRKAQGNTRENNREGERLGEYIVCIDGKKTEEET